MQTETDLKKILTLIIETKNLGSNITTVLKTSIRSEINAILSRFLIGTLLVSIVIFSFIQASNAYQTILARNENGVFLQLSTFLFITIGGIAALYIQFKPEKKVNIVKNERFEHLANSFLEGIKKGYEEKKAHSIIVETEPNTKAQETNINTVYS